MVSRLLISGLLMAACVAVHAAGLIAAFRWLDRGRVFDDQRFWYVTGMLIAVAGCLVGMHISDIALWGAYYWWGHALQGFRVALYFSAVTYTTVGYGDVVLPDHWRLVGGVEALTGILMCGWSTGAFFSIVHRMTAPRRPHHAA
jgi:hypothetical protein